MEKLTYTVKEMAEVLGVGIGTAYQLVHSDGFPALFLNTRILIPKEQLSEWLKKQTVRR